MSTPSRLNSKGSASAQGPARTPLGRIVLWAAILLAVGFAIVAVWKKGPEPAGTLDDTPVTHRAPSAAATELPRPDQHPAAPTREDRLALPPPAVQAEPGFRLSAMISGSGEPDSIWIVDRKAGEGHLRLGIGDTTPDGWRLLEINLAGETATFQKQGQTYVARMEGGSPSLPSESPPSLSAEAEQLLATRRDLQVEAAPEPVIPPEEQRLPTQPSDLAGGRVFSEPFRNRTLLTDSGGIVMLQGVDHAPEIVEIVTGADRYAIRRDIAESILQVDDLTSDERLEILESYPGLVKVSPDEDPAEQAVKAERELAEILQSPPDEPPPIEELDQLIDEVFDDPPEDAPDLSEL